MKQKTESADKQLPKGFTIDPTLDGKYDNDPFFLEKARQANEFIKKHGLPNELTRDKSKKEKTRTD